MRAALTIAIATLTLGLASGLTPALQVRDDVSPVESIRMIDAEIGWAVTARCGPCPPHRESGLMLRTASGGTDWKDVTPADTSGRRIDVPYFHAFNSHIAWVSRVDPVGSMTTEIFHTINGGRTWRSTVIPARNVNSISFINPREGWLIAFFDAGSGNENVDIYRSTDGGESWIRVTSARDGGGESGLPYGDKSSIAFANPTTGWITGLGPKPDSLYLYVTRDGGRTWRQQNLLVPPPPPRQQSQPLPSEVKPHWDARARPPKFFTATDGIMRVDYAHYLFNDSTGDEQNTGVVFVYYVTHDGGTTWAYTASVPIGHIDDRRPSSFANMNHGWVKEEDTLYVTSDGGRRWTTIRPGALFADVTWLDFVSPKVGWAVRNTDPYGGGAKQTSPFLLKTMDGGRTWTAVTYTVLP